MTFLQPALLWALPIVALPVVIHLINRQRHRTMSWAAMEFLLRARRRTRAMARLRNLLIMATRIAVLLMLILGASRPLATGWFGSLTRGQPDTAIVLLDRSPSMEQRDPRSSQSKRATALAKLSDLFGRLGEATRIVLIESANNVPLELDDANQLVDLPMVRATSASADVPAMLQAALDYVVANQTGRTDIWLCSDLRAHDWDLDSGRWTRLREGFQQQKGVQFRLLTYGDAPRDNFSIFVEQVKRRQNDEGAWVSLDILIRGHDESTGARDLPVEVVLNGSRSLMNVALTGPDHRVQGHEFPIDPEMEQGWGFLQLPGDTNSRDNRCYFTFAEAPMFRTLIVSHDRRTSEPIRLACQASSDADTSFSAKVVAVDTFSEIELSAQALIVWHAPLPTGTVARQLSRFAKLGRTIMFFPPAELGEGKLFGTRWGDWIAAQERAFASIASWQSDADLLRHANSGAALPVGDLRIYRFCSLVTKGRPLAAYGDGNPFLIRAPTDDGAVYFCSTLPRTSHSTLARDGVVFYVMLQRALSSGAASLGNAVQRTAGTRAAQGAFTWKPLSRSQERLVPSEYPFQSGAFRNGEQLIALNRHPLEDDGKTVDAESLQRLFQGLDYVVIQDRLDRDSMLASEMWKLFLVAMGVALVVEALLCMPSSTVDAWTSTAA